MRRRSVRFPSSSRFPDDFGAGVALLAYPGHLPAPRPLRLSRPGVGPDVLNLAQMVEWW